MGLKVREKILSLYHKITELDDYAYLIIVLASFLHASFIFVFYYLSIYEMVVFNIFSTLFYVTASFTFKNKYSKYYYTGAYLEIFSHQLAGMYFTGSYSGFDLLLCCLILAQFTFFKRILCLFSTIVIIFIMYINYFYPDLAFLHSEKYFINEHYLNAKDFLYPFNMLILLTFLIAWGMLVTAIPSKKLNDLRQIVYKDFLTGLHNRQYISEVLIYKYEKQKTIIAICDIDNFKHINDTYGHQVGDIVLKTISLEFLKKCKKYEHLNMQVCRWGGEEFLITANYTKDTKAILDEIREEIESLRFHEFSSKITITIGAYLNTFNPKDYKQIFEIADKNLYIGKQSGKNKVVLSESFA